MLFILVILFILTTADFGLTYAGIKADVINEANPLMRIAFHTQPEMTFLVCTLLALLFLAIIWRYGRQFKYLKAGLAILVAVKIFVIFTHAHWILQVI